MCDISLEVIISYYYYGLYVNMVPNYNTTIYDIIVCCEFGEKLVIEIT